MKLIEDQEYQNCNFVETGFEKGKYQYCDFTDCMMSGLDIRDCEFVECRFDDCDLSNAMIGNTALKGVEFSTCKLLGVGLADVNTFLMSVSLTDCILDLCSFASLDLKTICMRGCSLKGADFTEAKAIGYDWSGAILDGARFVNSNLSSGDFSKATGYTIDPRINVITGATFSSNGFSGLLDCFDIKIV